MLEFWTFGLSKLKEIEEYYEIKFKLAPLSGSDKVMELYDSIVFVYNGIMLNENCDITLPSSSFDDDIVIEEPFLCQDVKAKLFCPEIAGLFCRIAGLFCHDSRANLSLKPVCFGIAIS